MNPATGNFLTMDTYEGSIYDLDTLHKYLYANRNPVTYITSYPFVIIPVSGHALHRLLLKNFITLPLMNFSPIYLSG